MIRVSAPVAPPSRTYRLQIDRLFVLLQSLSIMASKCISKLPRCRPPSASPNSLDRGLQCRSITASNCISKLARSRPPSASPNSLDRGLQVYLQSRSITASKVHLQCRSITASKCISKLARSRPPSASPKSLDYGLQSASANSLDHGLGVYP